MHSAKAWLSGFCWLLLRKGIQQKNCLPWKEQAGTMGIQWRQNKRILLKGKLYSKKDTQIGIGYPNPLCGAPEKREHALRHYASNPGDPLKNVTVAASLEMFELDPSMILGRGEVQLWLNVNVIFSSQKAVAGCFSNCKEFKPVMAVTDEGNPSW